MICQRIDTPTLDSSSFDRGSWRARQRDPWFRRDLSLQALCRTEPLTRLAARHAVSRKFVYQQRAKATAAVDQAFQPRDGPESQVLFRLPVTPEWLEQLVLSLTLMCHSSYRGVQELLETMFDYQEICLGHIHNLLRHAVDRARQVNATEPLSAIRVGAHEEIYQARQPVLVGMDVASTYGYLLAAAEHCEETTWGVHLLELQDRGLPLDYTLADAGQALRAGQKAAWGDLPCHGDLFHAEKSLTELSSFLANRARACTAAGQFPR